VEAADPFQGFFASVIESIEKRCFSALAEDLLQDAAFLETMRDLALGEYRR
jgi:hypothetical protein